jgi:hypothetical protein
VQGLRVVSPDGRRYLLNKEDEKGTAQVYIGNVGRSERTCITCAERPRGPKTERFKMQPVWHLSGRWILLAVERDAFSPPPLLGLSRKYVEGQLQSGLFTNMYAVSPDGMQWHRLSDFKSGVPARPTASPVRRSRPTGGRRCGRKSWTATSSSTGPSGDGS